MEGFWRNWVFLICLLEKRERGYLCKKGGEEGDVDDEKNEVVVNSKKNKST
jgi:hypothetical protein